MGAKSEERCGALVSWIETGLFPTPAKKHRNVPVILASSTNYLPFACLTIFSVMESSSEDYFYDFIILTSGYSEDRIKIFNKTISNWTNCSIRLLDIRPHLDLTRLKKKSYRHVSFETFYRLLVPSIFINYEKVIYLDCDLIVRKDISELLNSISSNDNNLLVGVRDLDMIGQFRKTISMKYYLKYVLRIIDPDEYIQAGVLVFNVSKIRETFPINHWINAAYHSTIKFVDQDILNSYCKGHISFLDWRWNVVTDCGGFRIMEIISNAPLEMQTAYMESRDDPWIIHYSGYDKPWIFPTSDMAEIYLSCVSRSGLVWADNFKNSMTMPSFLTKTGMRLINYYLPQNTKRRDIINLAYSIFKYKLKEK